MADIEVLAKKILEELNKYELGGAKLDKLFEPVVRMCARLARDPNDLKTCIRESIETLYGVTKRIRLE